MQGAEKKQIRNIAIIAHVDHGKTTLVDKLIDAGRIIEEHKVRTDLLMDNNDLERERGITILSKNVSVVYKGVKINIIDTPGHSDFGGEVERVLNMADGVLLLVDAFEGPMPQTRFVLEKAISMHKKVIVVVNKVDKENCKPDEVHEKVFDLMFELGASEEQLEFPCVYGSAKQNWMSLDYKVKTDNILTLLDQVVEHIPAHQEKEGNTQLLITSIDHSKFTGRIAIGRLQRGTLQENVDYALCKRDGTIKKVRIKELAVFTGLGKEKVAQVQVGDICAITGVEGFEIGDTIADLLAPEALPTIAIDEPTMSMMFTINNSPFFGKEGKFVTSRHIRERLEAELEKNLAMKMQDGPTADSFLVFGRGVLHLSILIETMRREGYELQIGQPKVLFKDIDGKKCEPIEDLEINLPESIHGKAIEMVTARKGEIVNMEPKGDRMFLKFKIPSRGIIGLRNNLLTVTAGEAVMAHRFLAYEPFKGEIPSRINGSLISMNTGKTTPFSIDNLQDRGKFFVDPGVEIYEGQVVGESNQKGDIVVNITKEKALTNMRASGSDDSVRIIPAVKFSLEQALEYIQEDEYVELTPLSLRIRKIHLKEVDRKRK